MTTGDLYAALGVPRTASVAELRAAFDRIRSTHPPASAKFSAAAQAYAVLGDPRLRAEYDAGRVVGTGAGNYFEPAPRRRVTAASSGGVGRLEQRWRKRVSDPPSSQPLPRAQLRARWPFVFVAGNVSGFFLTVIGIRLALGHPIGN